MKNLIIIILATIFAIFIQSCEDLPPTSYVEEYVLEALILIDEPIQGIILTKTQPLFEPYNYDSAMIRDALIIIKEGDDEFELKFRPKEEGIRGYFYADTNYLVKAETNYSIEVTLPNGNKITGTTLTPAKTAWDKRPDEMVNFPKDSIGLPPTDTLSWQKVTGFDFFLIAFTNLDTLEYGKYLEPQTTELNRRIERPWREDRFYREVSGMGPIPATKSPIIWSIFKWYGKHSVTVYSPDWNFLRWFLQAQGRGQAEPILTSIEGGIGYFGSAHAIRDTFFLVKNQP